MVQSLRQAKQANSGILTRLKSHKLALSRGDFRRELPSQSKFPS